MKQNELKTGFYNFELYAGPQEVDIEDDDDDDSMDNETTEGDDQVMPAHA